jgi:hypothetical protein
LWWLLVYMKYNEQMNNKCLSMYMRIYVYGWSFIQEYRVLTILVIIRRGGGVGVVFILSLRLVVEDGSLSIEEEEVIPSTSIDVVIDLSSPVIVSSTNFL